MTAEDLKGQAINNVKGSDPSGHKRTAIELMYASESGKGDVVSQLTNDDFQFQFMKRGEGWVDGDGKTSSRLNKTDFIKTGVPMVNDLMKNGMNFRIELAMEEGDRVAIFGESHGESKAGRPYNNRYCWRFTFCGDKVSEFLEFCDTHHAVETLFS